MQLNREVCWNFVFPFWTGIACQPVPPGRRLSLFATLADALNEVDKLGLRWEATPLHHPPSLARRKGVVLESAWPGSDKAVDDILAQCEQFGVVVAEQEWRIEYFDLGLGTVELNLKLRAEESDFARLGQFLIETKRRIISIGRTRSLFEVAAGGDEELELFRHWPMLEHSFAQAFERVGLARSNWFQSAGTARSHGRLRAQNANLYFLSGGDESFEVSSEELAEFICRYTGERATADGLPTGCAEAPYMYCANSGAVAVVADAQARSRVQRLWTSMVRYWGAMHGAAEGIYGKLMTTDAKGGGPEARTELENIEHARQVIALMKYEARPESMTSESFEMTAYGRFWRAWNTDDLMESVDEQTTHLGERIESLNARISNRLASSINVLVLFFTLITVVGVAAEVISYYDFDNRSFGDKLIRAQVLTVVTVAFVTGSLVYLWFSARGRAARRRR